MGNYKALLKDYYDRNVEERDSKIKPPWKIDLRNHFLEIMKDHACTAVLEIGAGTGQDCLFFMDNGFDVTAVDLSTEHVKRCREKGINAHVMDFSDMDFKGGRFDCVYAMNCLLHVPNEIIDQVMKEITRVLKAEGLLIICQYGGKDDEGIKSYEGKGKRFFSFRSFEGYKQIIKRTGLTILESGEMNVGKENHLVQHFVVRKLG